MVIRFDDIFKREIVGFVQTKWFSQEQVTLVFGI